MRILLVDDQKEFRLLAKQHLKTKGHEVAAVASGQEALRVLPQEQFDAILLDEQMPGMTGTEILRQIRGKHPNLSRAPVIAMTGDNTEETKERLLQAGFDSVVGKPFSFELLDAIVCASAAGEIPAPEPAAA